MAKLATKGNGGHGKRRALALSGGGPAVGVSIGFLDALERTPLDFEVWSMSCVGAWAGTMYHLSPDRNKKFEFAHDVVRSFFRPDRVYEGFPTPTVFLPDFPAAMEATFKFVVDPKSYKDMIVPEAILKGYKQVLDTWFTPSKWSPGDFANMIFNGMMAPNPYFRFVMSLIYKSEILGMSKLYFPNYSVFKEYIDRKGRRVTFDMDVLEGKDVPVLYHNAFDVVAGVTELFSNKNNEKNKYKKITFESLCACSALPYILSPVEIEGTVYIEGATVDTVSFKNLLKNHPELNEIWVSNIVARPQVVRQKNLLGALQNLVMMFSCTAAEDDIAIFKQELKTHNESASKAKQIALFLLPKNTFANFDWTESNFDRTVKGSSDAASMMLNDYVRESEKGNQNSLSVEEVLVK